MQTLYKNRKLLVRCYKTHLKEMADENEDQIELVSGSNIIFST